MEMDETMALELDRTMTMQLAALVLATVYRLASPAPPLLSCPEKLTKLWNETGSPS